VSFALRWIRYILLADILILVGVQAVLFVAKWSGLDIQGTKWTVVFYGGIMLAVGVLLSVVALLLQVLISVRRRLDRGRG
jgi:hypothetical protein